MTKKIDLSIVIVSHNTRLLLKRCLDTMYSSLSRAPFTYEVIVVENNSTDGTLKMLKSYKSVKIILNPSNYGYGKANNQGIMSARGEVILLLNSDIEVLNNAIGVLFAFFLAQPQNSFVGGKLFNLDLTPQPSCGPAYSLKNIFVALFLKGDFRGNTRYSPDTTTEVDWIMGSCMMFHKSITKEVGYFDENIFMYMDEIDLQYRAKKLGYRIIFYPEAKFIHVGSGSSKGRELPILNVFRGFIYFYKKHYNIVHNLILRVLLILKSSIAIVFFSILNNKYNRTMYLKALKIALST